MSEAMSTASSRPRTWSVRSSGAGAPGALQAEGVLDREEVEQAPLGGAGEVGPVRGAEDVAGPGRRIAPRRRVEPGAVERDGEVERSVAGQARQRIATVRGRGRPGRPSCRRWRCTTLR